MTDVNKLRPDQVTPLTSTTLDKSQLNADVAHEGTLRYFVEQTELGVLTKEQMALISLSSAYESMGFDMGPVQAFFEKQRQLSSGEDGRGRIQVKDAITTSTLQLPWMYGNNQGGGILEGLKNFVLRRPSTPEPTQQGR